MSGMRRRFISGTILITLVLTLALWMAGGGGSPAAAQDAEVRISPVQVTVAPGASTTVKLDVTAPAGGLGAWTVDVTYDPAVVRADNCTSSNSICNKSFTANKVRVTGANAMGLTGTATLADITLTAVGPGGASSPLTPVIVTFTDPTGTAIQGPTATPGSITLSGGGTPESPTATSVTAATPTATLTPTPTATPTATRTPTPTATTGTGAIATATPTPTPEPPIGSGQGTVDGNSGGQVTNEGGSVTLDVPAGAFQGMGTVTITPRQLRASQQVRVSSAGPRLLFLSKFVDVVHHLVLKLVAWPRSGVSLQEQGPFTEPQGFLLTDRSVEVAVLVGGQPLDRFTQPVTLRMSYTGADLGKAGSAASNLHLMRYIGGTQRWAALDTRRDPQAQTLSASVEAPGLFAIVIDLPEPTVKGPVVQAPVPNFAPLLEWVSPSGTAQYQIQVLPAPNPFTGQPDGPAINLIIGAPDLVARSSYQVQAPQFGTGNYLLLPGMSYTWKVRTTAARFPVGEHDPQWSNWVEGSFSTAAPMSGTISPQSPVPGSPVGSLRPTLVWQNTDPSIFYYEVRLSKDPAFDTDPTTATAAVFWELVHGGQTTPLNSYSVRAEYPLEPRTTYHWQVRPRVQGDGTPVAWSSTWRFTTP